MFYNEWTHTNGAPKGEVFYLLLFMAVASALTQDRNKLALNKESKVKGDWKIRD